MGKLDDMRRLREQQFADSQRQRTRVPSVEGRSPGAAPKPTAAAPAPGAGKTELAEASSGAAPTRLATATGAASRTGGKKPAASRAVAASEVQGKCPGCGKMKPLKNGLLAQHQKGFGKACAGSRKEPV